MPIILLFKRNVFYTTGLVDILDHPEREERKKIVKESEMSEIINRERKIQRGDV